MDRKGREMDLAGIYVYIILRSIGRIPIRKLGWKSPLIMIVLLWLPVTSSYAGIIKHFDARGELIANEALPGYTIPLVGSLTYVDPDPAQDNLISLDEIISLELDPNSFDILQIPYIPPSPQFGAKGTVQEIGNMIVVNLEAYNQFDISEDGEVLGGVSWSMGNNYLFIDNGHGEDVRGDVQWTAVPAPSTLLLFCAGLAVQMFRRLFNDVVIRG